MEGLAQGGAWGSVGWGLSVRCPPAVVHGSRPEEVIDHRLTEREWAEEWKHLNNVSVRARAQVPQLCPTVGLRGQAQAGSPLLCADLGGMGQGLGGRVGPESMGVRGAPISAHPPLPGQLLGTFPSLSLHSLPEGRWV